VQSPISDKDASIVVAVGQPVTILSRPVAYRESYCGGSRANIPHSIFNDVVVMSANGIVLGGAYTTMGSGLLDSYYGAVVWVPAAPGVYEVRSRSGILNLQSTNRLIVDVRGSPQDATTAIASRLISIFGLVIL
jgi:hypothetical protein